jgi:uncharacterized protein YlxP (DUF503 family)
MSQPDAPPVHVGALAVTLHLPEPNSLKEKRRIIKSIKDRVSAKFNASVSEIGEHDKWQAAVLGFSIISNDKNLIASQFDDILSLIDSVSGVRITAQQIEYL